MSNLLLSEKGYPNVPDVKALERKISELESEAEQLRMSVHNARIDARRYRLAVSSEDNASELYAAVMCNSGSEEIDAVFDAAMKDQA